MKPLSVASVSAVKREITLLGDKSIAHRAIIISAITPGKTIIENFPDNQDCLSTINAFKSLTIKITQEHKNYSRAG